MFSMCGLLCRFLRGWRQSEAVGLMVHAASLKDASLIVETIEAGLSSSSSQEGENHSLFCQPFCKTSETRCQQLLWRDNNKQATIVTPKEKVDLVRWTLFLSNSPSNKEDCCLTETTSFRSASTPVSTPVSSSSRKNSACSECENIITVLLEASYREKEEESLYGYQVMVEQLAEPYAWKARDVFGVIIHTTPTKLVSMIHAFFNNALIIDDDLSIRKILTVDLVGEPSTLRDPSTISDCVTPGPWSHSGNVYTQMELARATPMVSPGIGFISIRNLKEQQQLKGQLTLKKKKNEKELTEPKHPSLVEVQKVSSSQSSEEEVSSESDIAPLDLHQLCPRGWAVSGLKPRSSHTMKLKRSPKVVLGQPLSMNFGSKRGKGGILSQENMEVAPSQRLQPSSFFTSIISNPLNDFLAVKENLTQRARINKENFYHSKDKRYSLESRKSLERFFTQRDLTNPLLHYVPQIHQTPRVKTKEALGFSPKICSGSSPRVLKSTTLSFFESESLECDKKSSILAEENNYPKVVIQEPKSHPLPTKIKSEADLLKSSNLIKDNLANIVENYLRKSPEVPHRSAEAKTVKEMKDPKVMLINSDDNDEANTESILMVTMEETSLETNDITKTFDPLAKVNNEKLVFNSETGSENSITAGSTTHRKDYFPYSMSADSFYLSDPHSVRLSCPNILTGSSNTNSSLAENEEFSKNISDDQSLIADGFQELALKSTENNRNLNFSAATLYETNSKSEIEADVRLKPRLTEGQESVESDLAEQSFSEDSLNEKLTPEDKIRAALCPVTSSFFNNETQHEAEHSPLDKVSIIKSIQMSNDRMREQVEGELMPNENQVFSSTEEKLKSFNLNNYEQNFTKQNLSIPSLTKVENHNSNNEEMDGHQNFVVESLAEMLSKEVDKNSPLDDSVKSLCNSVSFEDNSFSEDSLASAKVFETFGAKQSPISGSKAEIDSLVSTPEDFTVKTDCIDDLSTTGLPMHWHEEYVKVFSDANHDLRESLHHSAVEIISPPPVHLEPIEELASSIRGEPLLSNQYGTDNNDPLMMKKFDNTIEEAKEKEIQIEPQAEGKGEDGASDGRSSFAKSSLSNSIQISYFSKNKLQTILEAQSASKSEEDIHSLLSEDSPTSSPYFGSFSSAISMEISGEQPRIVDIENSKDPALPELNPDACSLRGDLSAENLVSQNLFSDGSSNVRAAESDSNRGDLPSLRKDTTELYDKRNVKPIENDIIFEDKILKCQVELKSIEHFSSSEELDDEPKIKPNEETRDGGTCHLISGRDICGNNINELLSENSNPKNENEDRFTTQSNEYIFQDSGLFDPLIFEETIAESSRPLISKEKSADTLDDTPQNQLESCESLEESCLLSDTKEVFTDDSLLQENPSNMALSFPGDEKWPYVPSNKNLQDQSEFQSRQDDGFGDVPSAHSQGEFLPAFTDICRDSSPGPEAFETGSAAFCSEMDTTSFTRCDEPFVFSPVAKAALSPVDSAPESGFASLKDSSHSEATSESGSGVPLSKSKDSLEMTDSERDRAVGMDVLLDEFDSFGGANHGGQTGSNPASAISSARGSLMDDLVYGHSKELEILDIENVKIPSDHADNDLFSLTSSPIVPKRGKLMSVNSLDSDHRPPGFLKHSDRIRAADSFDFSISLSGTDTSENQNERDIKDPEEESDYQINKSELEMTSRGQMSRKLSEDSGGGQISKSESEENEGQILKTSDSISSSETIISRTSFEEQERIINEKQLNICDTIHLDPTCTQQTYEEQMKSYFYPDHHHHIQESKNGSGNSSIFPMSSSSEFGTKNRQLICDVETLNDDDLISGIVLKELPGTRSNASNWEDKLSSDAGMSVELDVLIDKSKNRKETLIRRDKLNTLIKNNDKKRVSKTVKPKSLEEVVNRKYSLVSDARINETAKILSKSLSDGTNTFDNSNIKPRTLKGTMKREADIELSNESLYSLERKNNEKKLSLFHSENNLGKSSSSDKSSEGSSSGSHDKSLSSSRSNTYSSSGEIIPEKASLRSQDSLDKFTHFDAISAQAKPKTGLRRKKGLSVQVDSTSESDKNGHGSESLHRSVTLPACPLTLPFKSSKQEKKQQLVRDEKIINKKSKESSDGAAEKEKKSSLLSLRGLLKRHKSKETKKEEPSEKRSSPSLFRKLEKKAKSSSSAFRKSDEKNTSTKVPISHPLHVSKLDNLGRVESLSEDVVREANGKTHPISNGTVPAVREGVTKMGTKSPLHRNNASSPYVSGSESEANSSPGASPLPRKNSLGGSPLLYRRVLMRNLSSSQESLDAPPNTSPGKGVSPHTPSRRRRASESCAQSSAGSSPAPLMGTRALRASPKRFSVTIGFKPEVKHPSNTRTVSIGEELNKVTASATLPGRMTTPHSPASTLTKRSSSMEILVCGKIREHNPSRKRSTGGCSREGSFKLHREISVETLVEVPEAGFPSQPPEEENYEEYLRRVQESRDSRQSSAWSLCENDGSSLSESIPLDPFLSHTPLHKKLSLPHNLYLSGPSEDMSSSNPNLSSRIGSPFISKLPLSSSFTSSPFRRPVGGLPSGFSPIKRNLASQGKSSLTSPGNDSCPASPLVEEEEETDLVCETDSEAVTDDYRPPNVLVYTGNNKEYFEDVKETLVNSFGKHRYVIYHLTDEMAFKSPWKFNTSLLVVCGDVATHVSTVFIRYLLSGGKVLSICSDFLNVAVPLFAFKLPWTTSLVDSGTVEVQEAAIVSMSYSKWKNVQLLHHQHCFHSSPKHKRFSKDLENKSSSCSAVSVEPTFVEITDECGVRHRLDLKVLAKDDTWGAPSLLVANVNHGNGKAIFSQVHLEKDPNKSISLNLKGDQLKKCNESRLEILQDLLCTYLDLLVDKDSEEEENCLFTYTPAFLLGKYEVKQKFLDSVKPYLTEDRLARLSISLQILPSEDCGQECLANEKVLPVFRTGYPNNFSTVKYFEELETTTIGRLVIYSDLVTSTMDIIAGNPPLGNGVAVIATQQTRGRGRQRNEWLSPPGCNILSLQLHIPLASNMGQCLPFLQHLISLAMVLGVKGITGYETIPLNIKWPNDIYLWETIKIGGVLVEASTQGGTVIVNIGCGMNLSNSLPTSCINDAIREHNAAEGTRLPELQREALCANIFNHIERLLDVFQSKGSDEVIAEYYNHWLHSNMCVRVQKESGHQESATIVGIDSYGYLKALLASGEMVILHPDGNSFNMLEGLIYTKPSTDR